MVARSLPAIILATIIAAVGLAGGERVHTMLLANEAVAVVTDPESGEGFGQGDLWIDERFQLPDGSLVDWQYFSSIGEEPYDIDGNPRYPIVTLVIPGERYRFVETRLAIVPARWFRDRAARWCRRGPPPTTGLTSWSW